MTPERLKLLNQLRAAAWFDPRPSAQELLDMAPDERSGYNMLRQEHQAMQRWIMNDLRPLLLETIRHLDEIDER